MDIPHLPQKSPRVHTSSAITEQKTKFPAIKKRLTEDFHVGIKPDTKNLEERKITTFSPASTEQEMSTSSPESGLGASTNEEDSGSSSPPAITEFTPCLEAKSLKENESEPLVVRYELRKLKGMDSTNWSKKSEYRIVSYDQNEIGIPVLESLKSIPYYQEPPDQHIDGNPEEIYANYSTVSDPDDSSLDQILQGKRVKVRSALKPMLTRAMKSKLTSIKSKLSLDVDMHLQYIDFLKQSLLFRSPVTGCGKFPKGRVQQLSSEIFDLMELTGIERYLYDPEEAWPWVPDENLTQEDWFYIEHVNLSLNLCSELVYKDEQYDMTPEEKDRLFNKLVAYIVEHTKKACCGDSAHVGMNHLLASLEKEKLPVRIAFLELQVLPANGEEVIYPVDREETGYDEDYKPYKKATNKRKRAVTLGQSRKKITDHYAYRRKAQGITPGSASSFKAQHTRKKNAEQFIANHIVIAVLPRTEQTLELPRQVTIEDLLSKDEAIIIDPALRMISLANDPELLMKYLIAFNLGETGRYQFQYTFLY